MCFRWAAATLMVASLFVAACYSPNISPGGFACGTDGGCPDNFHCAPNNLCYQGDASVEMPPPVCDSVTTVPPHLHEDRGIRSVQSDLSIRLRRLRLVRIGQRRRDVCEGDRGHEGRRRHLRPVQDVGVLTRAVLPA